MHDEANDDELAADLAAAAKARGRGRGRKGGTTVVTTRQVFDGEEKKPTLMTFGSLFEPGDDDANEELVTRVRVTRSNPDEGMLGYIDDMEATEATIKEQWGGSVYRLDGLNSRNRIVRVRTIKIAGDPIFTSVAAESQWRRAHGLPERSASSGPSVQAMLEMMDKREETRRQQERERDEQRRKEEREAEERRKKEEREFRADQERIRQEAEDRRRKEEREWEERRRKADEEADARRRRDEAERDERRRADLAERDQRQQQFMAQMLATVRESSNQQIALVRELSGPKGEAQGGIMETVKVIAAIKDAFGGEGGGEEEMSPFAILAKVAPQLAEGIGAAIREVRGVPAPAPVQQTTAGALPAMQLPPRLAGKVESLVAKVAAQGKDPERFLEQAVDTLHGALDNPQAAARAAATVNPQPVHSGEVVAGTIQHTPSQQPGERAKRVSFAQT